jgi:hypothetical protein
MANEVLQSIGRLNQYLGREVAVKRIEDRRDNINKVGSDIADEFMKLGKDATSAQVSAATGRAIGIGGEGGALQENLNVIGFLSNQGQAAAQLHKTDSGMKELVRALDETTYQDLSGFADPTAAVKYLEQSRAQELRAPSIKAGRNVLTIHGQGAGGLYEARQEVDMGPAGMSEMQKMQLKHQMRMEEIGLQGNYRSEAAAIKAGAKAGAGQKTSDVLAYQKRLKVIENDQAEHLYRQLYGDEATTKFLAKVPGGAVRKIRDLATNPEDLIEAADDAGFERVKNNMGDDVEGFAVSWPGVNYQNSAGTNVKGHTLVPYQLQREFQDLSQTMEQIRTVEANLTNRFVSNKQDNSQLPAAQREQAMSTVELAIGTSLENPDDANYSSMEYLIRQKTGDSETPAGELWNTMPSQDKRWVSTYVVNYGLKNK